MPSLDERLANLQTRLDASAPSSPSTLSTRLARLQSRLDEQADTPSALGTFGISAGRAALPLLAGAAGAGQAITAGAPLIAASGPFAPLTAVGIGLGGGFLAGGAASAAQEGALQVLAPDLRNRLNRLQARGQAEHPVAGFLGNIAPQLLTFRPSPRTLASAGQGLVRLARRLPLAPEQATQIVNVGAGGAIAAGSELSGEVIRGEPIRPARIVGAGATGALLNQPTRLGQRFGFRPVGADTGLIGTRTERVQTQFTDRFTPVRHLVELFEKVVGRKALPAENTFQAARLYAGIPGRMNVRAEQLGEILAPVANQADDLSRVLIAERNAELSAQGRGLSAGAQIRLKSGRVVPVQSLEQLAQELGPERFADLQARAARITEFNNNVLLADAVDAGIVSREAAAVMRTRNEKYVPFEVLETLADDLLQEGGMRFGRQSFQVAKQDVFKQLKGGAQALDDPLIAQMRRTFKITTLAERNRVGRTLLTARQATPQAEWIQSLTGTQRPRPGFSEFVVFENGKPTRWAIPTPVADAMKGLTQEAVDFVTRWASLSSRALRAGATTFSAGFALTNPIRDFQLAKLVSRQMGLPFNLRLWLRGFADALQVTRGGRDLVREFEDSLGSFGGFFRGGGVVGAGLSPEAALRRVSPTTGQRVTKIATTLIHPTAWIQKVGELGEMAPRLAVFRSAVRQGRSRPEAAFAARNATIDFTRVGTTMKLANMWVPFLNARLQGTVNTLGAVRGSPFGAAYVLTTMIGTPLVATYYWNTRRFPQVWADIPQWEKDNNFILILGDTQDAEGRYTQAVKIPKGDVGRMAGNPLENFLAFLDQRDPQSIDTVALKVLSDLSPIAFEREGKVDPGRALGSVTPPTVEAARLLTDVEAKSRFTGFPVVPRRLQAVSPGLRATERTSPTLRAAGLRFGISPIQTEAAIGTQFGTAGRQLLAVVDRLAFGRMPGRERIVSPITRRFAGVAGGGEEERQIERAIALRQRGLDAGEQRRREADQLLAQLRAMPNDPVGRQRILMAARQRDPKLVERLREIVQDERAGVTTRDRIVRSLPVAERAQWIAEELARRPTPQARRGFLQSLRLKKILTPQVAARLQAMRRQRTVRGGGTRVEAAPIQEQVPRP